MAAITMSGRRARSSGSSPLFLSRLFSSPRLASPRLASPLLGYQPDEPLADLFPSIASRCLFLSCSCSLPISLLPSPFSASSGSLLTLGSRTCSWPPARNRITGRQPASPRVEELYHQPFLFLYLPHTYTHTHTHVSVYTCVCDYLRSTIATLRFHRFLPVRNEIRRKRLDSSCEIQRAEVKAEIVTTPAT